jgi:hypothetical protein
MECVSSLMYKPRELATNVGPLIKDLFFSQILRTPAYVRINVTDDKQSHQFLLLVLSTIIWLDINGAN